MAKRASFIVAVDGTNISGALAPILLSLSVSDRAGTQGDTAKIQLDDTAARIVMPRTGADITISLGWQGGGLRQVFEGTVDEVMSSGNAAGGRTITVTAKGFDATGRAKEGQQRHWDDASVRQILEEAGADADIDTVEIDEDLAEITLEYFEMRDESYLHMGERLAHEIGGNFRVNGKTAIMSKRIGDYSPQIEARWGVNLHSWDITPLIGRHAYRAARSRWYDADAGEWREVEVETGIDAEAVFVDRTPRSTEAEARQQAEADAATIARDSGGGQVVIEGTNGAIPDGFCIVTGARPGVDGKYQIEAVMHAVTGDGGWVTSLELKRPESDGDDR